MHAFVQSSRQLAEGKFDSFAGVISNAELNQVSSTRTCRVGQEPDRMNSATASSARLTEQRPFVLFWLARLASTMGYQMLALTIGWQIYELTNSALDLGLVGLIQFVPAVVLTLLIGHVADRYDRRLIVRAAHSASTQPPR
jgi:hypothetical protein